MIIENYSLNPVKSLVGLINEIKSCEPFVGTW